MTVKQTFTGDANQLIREYDKVLKAQARLEEKLARANQISKQSAESTKGMKTSADKITSSLAGMVSGWLSVQAAAKLVTDEMALQRKLANDARLAAISLADSQAAVAKNIGDVSVEHFRKFIDEVQAVATETGFQSPAQLNVAASGLLSATGGDEKKTIELLRTAAPFFRDAPDQLGIFASRMGDIMKATGSSDAKETLALMLAIQGQSRFEDLSAFSNVAPALKSAVITQKGVDRTQATREAAALFAAIGQSAGDTEGAVTKTAVANLAVNLEKVIGGEGLSVIDRLRIAQKKIAAGGEEGARIQDELLKSGFKGSIKPIIRELVSDAQSDTSKAAFDALSKIQTSDEFVSRKTELLNAGTAQIELANASRKAEGRQEIIRATSSSAALGEARRQARAALERTSIPFDPGSILNRKATSIADIEMLQQQLDFQEDRIRKNPGKLVRAAKFLMPLPTPMDFIPRRRSDSQLSSDELEKVKELRAAAESLKQLAEIQKRFEEEQRQRQEASQPSVGAAVQTRVHDERE